MVHNPPTLGVLSRTKPSWRRVYRFVAAYTGVAAPVRPLRGLIETLRHDRHAGERAHATHAKKGRRRV